MRKYKRWKIAIMVLCTGVCITLILGEVKPSTRQIDVNTSLIAFERSTYSDVSLSGIYAASPDGKRICNIAGPGSGEPAWSPDGNQIAYKDQSIIPLHAVIIVRDLANGTQRDIGSGSDAVWLPDNRHLAIPPYQTGSVRGQVILMTISTGETMRLPIQAELYEPVWSPGGTQIAFTGAANETLNISIINSDGTQNHVITHLATGERALHPSWSPDGKHLAFTWSPNAADYRNTRLYVINIDGTQQRLLSHPPSESEDVWSTWSPDSRFVAFERVTFMDEQAIHGTSQIYSIALDGTQERLLSGSYQSQDRRPNWSPSDVAMKCL